VQCDHEGKSFVAAIDADDGRQLWRVARTEDSTWGTPTVHEVAAGKNGQLIVNGYKHIGGYDLDTGAVIWKLRGGGDVPVPTPVVADGLIYLTSAHGRSRPLRAIRVKAAGDLTDEENAKAFIAWNNPRFGVYMQTPLVYRGLLYACSDGGILAVYDPKTGARIYRQRIGGGETGFSGSLVAADGKIYLSGESGQIFVVKAGPEYESIATNDMGENCMATPAISDGMLFFRTRHHVVAIEQKKVVKKN
jgi:outer membrane protein assembly factor BamB